MRNRPKAKIPKMPRFLDILILLGGGKEDKEERRREGGREGRGRREESKANKTVIGLVSCKTKFQIQSTLFKSNLGGLGYCLAFGEGCFWGEN